MKSVYIKELKYYSKDYLENHLEINLKDLNSGTVLFHTEI